MAKSEPKSRRPAAQAPASKRRLWLIVALIAAALLIVYGRIVTHEFVSWDDETHISENPHYQPVTWQSIVRFWREPYFSLYIPVSYTFFAVEALLAANPPNEEAVITFDPAVFHAGSLLLHLACVLLVFALLRMMMRHDLAAAAGALLFGLHPLQVESVAWTSETRGLLASFFSLLATWHYLRFVGPPPDDPPKASGAAPAAAPSTASKWAGRLHYGMASLCFVLALLAKPSAAPLPLMVAALDLFWRRRPWWRTALAMAPWVAAAVAITIVTKVEQPSADMSYLAPWRLRPLIAADALTFYLQKLVAPFGLCIHYPRRPQEVAASPWLYFSWIVPLAVAVLCWSMRKRGPWLAAAGWFLAALSPVLGLVPFAFQAYSTVADRYAYLALFGPALLLTWWLARTTWPMARLLTVAGLCLLAGLSAAQTVTWKDSETLFRHILSINPNSSLGHNNWGVLLLRRDRYAEALPHLEIALRQDTQSVHARLNLALVLQGLGRIDEAIAEYETALENHPGDPDVRSNLGVAYFSLRRYEDAVKQYERALEIEPRAPLARFNLALAYDRLLQPQRAIAELNTLLDQHPTHYHGRMKLATLLASQGQRQAAIAQMQKVVERFPDKVEARDELSAVLWADGQPREALRQCQLGMRTDSPYWHWLAGRAALILATDPDASLRNGREALRLATAACERTNFQVPVLLQALAAAFAEMGDFERAVKVASTAEERAEGDDALQAQLNEQLERYRQGKTWHKEN